MAVTYGRRRPEDTHMPWGILVGLGVILALFGLAMIVYPLIATFAVTIALGWLLLVAGGLQVISSFFSIGRSNTHFWLLLVRGVLFAVAGWLLLAQPLAAVLTLTVALAVLFIVEGIARIAEGFAVPRGRGWLWFGGLVGIAVGLLLLFGLPEISLTALGLLVGINVLFHGISLLFSGFALHSYDMAFDRYRPTPV